LFKVIKAKKEDFSVFNIGNSKCIFKGVEEICRGSVINEKVFQFNATKVTQNNLY